MLRPLRVAISIALAGWINFVLMLLWASNPGYLLTGRGLMMFALAPAFVPWVLLFSIGQEAARLGLGTCYLAFMALCYVLLGRLFPMRLPPKPGYCAACGYDLRATPERCPECGAVAKPKPNG